MKSAEGHHSGPFVYLKNTVKFSSLALGFLVVSFALTSEPRLLQIVIFKVLRAIIIEGVFITEIMVYIYKL